VEAINIAHPAITRIPERLGDEFKRIMSKEKPPKTVGRPV
jgi:hypothetical protein